MMPLQRACEDESQVRNKLSNGPLRAQSNVVIGTTEYSATLLQALLAGDMTVSHKSASVDANQGGTTDTLFVLDRT